MLNNDAENYRVRCYATAGIGRYHAWLYNAKGLAELGTFNRSSPVLLGQDIKLFFRTSPEMLHEQKPLDGKFRALTQEEEQEFLAALRGE